MDKYIILFLLLALIFSWFLSDAMNKAEQQECFKWQQQAKEIEGFYPPAWGYKQCERWGIEIQ